MTIVKKYALRTTFFFIAVRRNARNDCPENPFEQGVTSIGIEFC
jgi:hypothetical protein